jgi:hypothetical protein
MAALIMVAGCDKAPARGGPAATDTGMAAISAAVNGAADTAQLPAKTVEVQGKALSVRFDLRCLGGQDTQMALVVSGAPAMKVFEPSSRGAMSTSVSTQIDDRAPLSEPWTLSGAMEEMALSPSAVDLGMQLRGAKRLVVSFQPFGAKRTTLEWELSGLASQLARTARECRWPMKPDTGAPRLT